MAGGGVLVGEGGEGDVLVGACGNIHTPVAIHHLALGRRVDGGEMVGVAAAIEAEGLRDALRGGWHTKRRQPNQRLGSQPISWT